MELFEKEVENFGGLKWNSEPFKNSVNFLDLTVTIHQGKIYTKTYQKPMNLYLYIPPHSAHQPGIVKSLIFGQLQRYWLQNTYVQDYKHYTSLLFDRLLDRGHTSENLKPIFLQAAQKIENQNRSPKQLPSKHKNTIYLHSEFHPDGIPPKKTHKLFSEHCSKISETLDAKLCLSYSQPPNVRDTITKTSLHNLPKQKRASELLFNILQQKNSRPTTKNK